MNTPLSITTTFEHEPAQHYRLLRAMTRETPLRWMPAVFAGLLLLLIVLGSWGAMLRGRSFWSVLVDAVPYLLLAAFWLVLIPWSQRRRASRLPQLDASMQGPQVRALDAAGFHSRGNGVSLDVPWHAFKRAVETPEFFLLFYNWQCAYAIPKPGLAADEVRAARELLQANLGERARLLRA